MRTSAFRSQRHGLTALFAESIFRIVTKKRIQRSHKHGRTE